MTTKADIIHKINEMVTGEDDDFAGEFLFGDDAELKLGKVTLTGKQIKGKVNERFIDNVLMNEDQLIDWDYYWQQMKNIIEIFLGEGV